MPNKLKGAPEFIEKHPFKTNYHKQLPHQINSC